VDLSSRPLTVVWQINKKVDREGLDAAIAMSVSDRERANGMATNELLRQESSSKTNLNELIHQRANVEREYAEATSGSSAALNLQRSLEEIDEQILSAHMLVDASQRALHDI
jgi:hypothetical protein